MIWKRIGIQKYVKAVHFKKSRYCIEYTWVTTPKVENNLICHKMPSKSIVDIMLHYIRYIIWFDVDFVDQKGPKVRL